MLYRLVRTHLTPYAVPLSVLLVLQLIGTLASLYLPSLNGRIIGFAIMRYGDDRAHLDLLAVAPAYRGLGIARQLLEWLEKCALVAGIFHVALEVRTGNAAAQLFYQRMGYRVINHIPGYYQGIEGAVRMGRDLSSKPRPDETLLKPFY